MIKLTRNFAIYSTILVLILAINIKIYGQEYRPFQDLDIQSPNAAALEKFGEIPVSYHTGIPQIEIPIYTVTSGALSLPISLNYHAGGLKVGEISSWVGAGWSLMAGGAITREVRGVPDEKITTLLPDQLYGHYTHNGYNSYVRNEEGNLNFADFNDVASGLADGEPDMYRFSFNGISGQFYFDDDGTPVFRPASDYKIEVLNNPTEGFYKWVITTPDGTRYHFGQGEDESGNIETDIRAEKTHPYKQFTGTTFHSAYSSWLLTKIESADGEDVIRLHYTSEKFGYHAFTPFFINTHKQIVSWVKYNIDGFRLTKISSANGSVEFVPGNPREDLSEFNLLSGSDVANTEAKNLDEIHVKKDDGTCIKKYKLTSSYFNNTSDPTYYNSADDVSTDRKRLKLDQVQEIKCGGETLKPPYIFSYYNETSIPRRLSYARDHWGYYNGKTGNTTLEPASQSGQCDRESDATAMLAGTLSQIQYPTGGSSTFEYDANNVYRVYSVEEPSETLYTSHSTSGINPVYKTVNFEAGNYWIEFSCYADGDATAFLSVGQGSDAVSHSVGNGEVITEIAYLSGDVLLTASSTESWVTGTMKIYKTVTNHYDKNFDVGGLRIAKITQSTSASPGNNNDVVTEYDYEHNGTSSGLLYGRPTYVSLLRNDFKYEYGMREAGGRDLADETSYGCESENPQNNKLTSYNSLFPMEHSNGYHIGYEYVVVSKSNGSKSQYQYEIAADRLELMYEPIAKIELEDYICDMDVSNFPPAPLPYVPNRGELLAEYHYAGLSLVKEVRYNNVYTPLSGNTPALIATSLTIPISTLYELNSAKLTSTTITTKTYGNSINDVVEVVQQYDYLSNKHNQVSSESKITNNGTYSLEYTYPMDYTTGCEVSNTSYTTYQNALNTCAITYPYNNYDFSTGDWYYTRINYDGCISTARADYALDRISDKNDAETCLNTSYNNADAVKKPVLALISTNRHLPIEIANWKDDNLFLGSSFNQYKDFGSYRNSGLVYPEKVYAFQTSTPLASSSFTPSLISGNSIAKDVDYSTKGEVEYLFDNGRIAELTKLDESIESYLWGYNNSKPIIEAKNISHSTLENAVGNAIDAIDYDSYSYTNGINDLDNLLDDLNNIKISSEIDLLRNFYSKLKLQLGSGTYSFNIYTYDPLIGITSATDENGITTFYRYDSFGRLEEVLDNDGNIINSYEYKYAQ